VVTQLMTTQEAADFLGLAYDNARKLLRDYEPAQTVGCNKLWTRKQIEQTKKDRAKK
jgi:hypothetical protein